MRIWLTALALLFGLSSLALAQTIELFWDTPGSAEEQAGYRAVADRFEELHPNVKVHTNLGLSHDDVIVRIAAGTPPDIVFSTIQNAAGFIKQGLLMPLDAWIERDGFDIDDFFPAVLTPYLYDGSSFGQGQLYGFPKESAVRGTFYNATLFEEAGLAQPPELYSQNAWNWNTWLSSAQKLTRVDGSGATQQWGFVRDTRLMYQMMWVWANNGDIVDDLLNPTRFTLDSDEAVEALEFYADMAHVYRVSPAEYIEGSAAAAPFVEGRAGLLQDGPWRMSSMNANPSLEYGVVQGPVGAKRANLLSGSIFGIPKGVNDPELSWELLKFLASREGQQILVEVASLQPARRSLANVFIETDPSVNMAVFLEEVDFAQPLFAMPGMDEIDALLVPYLRQVAEGTMSVTAMLDTVKPLVEGIIARVTK